MKHYTSRHKVETLTPSRRPPSPPISSGSSSLFSSSRSIPRSSTLSNGHPAPVHFSNPSISSHRNFSPIKRPSSAKSPLKNDVKSFYNFTTDLMRDLDGLSKPRGQYNSKPNLFPTTTKALFSSESFFIFSLLFATLTTYFGGFVLYVQQGAKSFVID